MKSRLYLYGAFLACLAAIYFGYRYLDGAQWRAFMMPASTLRTDGQVRGVSDPAALRDRLLRPYRLNPDRRFLLALTAVDRMAGVTDSIAAGAEFRDGQWGIACNGREVGSLSELPDFAELDSVLTAWAGVQLSEHPLQLSASGGRLPAVESALAKLDPLWAVRQADRKWRSGTRSLELMRQAAEALTWLALETTDQVGGADQVDARAHAAIALARAAGAGDLARERALLASIEGYGTAARSYASTLEPDDPTRLFVEGDGDSLRAVVQSSRSSTRDRYLYLRHLSRHGDFAAWESWSERFHASGASALAVLSTGLDVERFEAHEPTAAAVLLALDQGLDASGLLPAPAALGPEQGQLGAMISTFESVMAKVPASEDGSYFDGELFRSYYRSVFYSAIDRIGRHYLESLSSVSATQWLSEEMRGPQGSPGARFHHWYSHLAAAKGGHPDRGALEADLDSLESFGAPMMLRTFGTLALTTDDPRARFVVRRLASHLDTRPDSRWQLGALLSSYCQLANPMERLMLSAGEAEGLDEPYYAAWGARYREDWSRLTALLEQPGLDALERAEVLGVAVDAKGLAPQAVERAYEGLIQRAPDDWAIADAYTKYLEDRKQYARGREVMERWLKTNHATPGSLQPIMAQTAIARLYEKEGRIAEGLAAIGDLDQSQQFGAMQRKASLLFVSGHKEEAFKLAFSAWQRYPDTPHSRMPLVELFWRDRRYANAAAVLCDPRYPLRSEDWVESVAPKFSEYFKDHPKDAHLVVESLRQTSHGSGPWQAALMQAAANDGNNQLAFELISQFKFDGMNELQGDAAAYKYLKHWKGEKTALEWIKHRAPMDRRPLLHLFGYQFDCDELCWELDYRSSDELATDYMWLMRAATILRRPDLASRKDAVLRYVRKPGGSYYRTAARYLMGLANQREVLELANTSKRQCELYYFMGVRSQVEGRLRDAADWYGMSVETGQSNNGEWRWAHRQLIWWLGQEHDLDAIARNPGQVTPEGAAGGPVASR